MNVEADFRFAAAFFFHSMAEPCYTVVRRKAPQVGMVKFAEVCLNDCLEEGARLPALAVRGVQFHAWDRKKGSYTDVLGSKYSRRVEVLGPDVRRGDESVDDAFVCP